MAFLSNWRPKVKQTQPPKGAFQTPACARYFTVTCLRDRYHLSGDWRSTIQNQSVKAWAKSLAAAQQTSVNTKLFFYERLKIQPFASVTPAAPELRRLCPVGLRSARVRRAKPACNPHIRLSRHISERICGSYSHGSAQSLSTARHRRVSQAAGRGERLHKNNPPANSAERR